MTCPLDAVMTASCKRKRLVPRVCGPITELPLHRTNAKGELEQTTPSMRGALGVCVDHKTSPIESLCGMKRGLELEVEPVEDITSLSCSSTILVDSVADINNAAAFCSGCRCSMTPDMVKAGHSVFICTHCDMLLCEWCKSKLPSCCACRKKLCTGCVDESQCSLCGIPMCDECAEGECVASFACCSKHALLCSGCEGRYEVVTCPKCNGETCDIAVNDPEGCRRCKEYANIKLDMSRVDYLLSLAGSDSLRNTIKAWRFDQDRKLATRGLRPHGM